MFSYNQRLFGLLHFRVGITAGKIKALTFHILSYSPMAVGLFKPFYVLKVELHLSVLYGVCPKKTFLKKYLHTILCKKRVVTVCHVEIFNGRLQDI